MRRLLRGDLDTIAGTAIKKAPSDRYPSVTLLADDVRRHLRHEPISARPDTLAYRAAKFVRRHRWPVAAALVTFAMLSTGLYVANRERLIAESRFRQLRQLSQQVFDLDARIRSLPGSTEARQALVAASLEYLEGLARDAERDLDLLQEVSDGYARVAGIQGVPTQPSLGNLAQAEASLAKADALADTILASRPRDQRALERSAFVAHDRMIVAQSARREEDALTHASQAAGRMDRVLADGGPSDSARNAASIFYGNLALAYVNMRHYDHGIRHASRQADVTAALASTPERRNSARGLGLSVLANARRLQGDLEGALTAIREARALADRSTTANEWQRMFDRYGILLREGFILGEDRAVSLERPAEAIVPLREAFEMTEALARRDPNDFTSRSRVATSGRELADILRWRDPQAALLVYDVAIGRLAEIRNSVTARRDRALILANSSYALRRLGRSADARRRVDEAVTILGETGDYPSDRIGVDAELHTVLQARADHLAASGDTKAATGEYELLLSRVSAAQPDSDNDLRTAYQVSLLYENLAGLYRATGAVALADRLDSKRLALWDHWSRKLPGNVFVLRRLRVAGSEPPPAAARP